VASVLWQKGALGFAARPQANSGPARVGKKTYFHLRSIAPSKTSDVPRMAISRSRKVHGEDDAPTTAEGPPRSYPEATDFRD